MVFDRRNGINRSFVVAAFGLVLIGASEPPKQAAKPEQTKTAQPEPQRSPTVAANTAKPIEAIKPAKQQEPCGPRRYHSDDDLCAQWKAADSASDAAQWAWWQTILSALGIVGLLFSLYYTRKAVLAAEDATRDADAALAIAERNAKAASELVAVSEKTASMQLRAYLAVQKIEPVDVPKTSFFAVRVHISNDGQTPAKTTAVSDASYIGPFPQFDPRQSGPAQTVHIHFPPVLNPGCSAVILTAGMEDADYDKFRNSGDDEALYIYGRVEYVDAFAANHWLEYCYRLTWSTRNLPEGCCICMAGNGTD